MPTRRRTTTTRRGGVRAASREAALKQAAAAHHSRKLSDALYRSRGGSTEQHAGRAYATKLRKKARRKHGVAKVKVSLKNLFGKDINPLTWLRANPGRGRKKKR
jgi:hypothetical protein